MAAHVKQLDNGFSLQPLHNFDAVDPQQNGVVRFYQFVDSEYIYTSIKWEQRTGK